MIEASLELIYWVLILTQATAALCLKAIFVYEVYLNLVEKEILRIT